MGQDADATAQHEQPASADAYDERARELAGMFATNFARYEDAVPSAVREAGPRT